LSGLTGSERGSLELRGRRLIYKPSEEGRPGFDVPLSEVSEIEFPWHYFSGGFKARVRGEQFRFSFIEPHNDSADVRAGRETGKAWKKVLLNG
jgi:hypothetical protein